MSAMNEGDGQAAQRLKRRDIGVRVRVMGIVDQRAVINDIAGEDATLACSNRPIAAGGGPGV